MKPFVKFSPFLLLYSVLILMFATTDIQGDEGRYIEYAHNLLKGFYTDHENPHFRNGPGYPMFLAVFLALNIPLIVAKLFNGLFLYLAVCYLYKTLLLFTSPRIATIGAIYLGLYYPAYMFLYFNMGEILTVFLICAFMYHAVLMLRSEHFGWKEILPTSLFLGYLVLNKYFFGNVVLAALVLAVLYALLFRDRRGWRYVTVLAIAFSISGLPYLSYTYSVTGRMMYWGTNGGEQIYWMSSTYPGEFGDWHSHQVVLSGYYSEMHPSHREFYESVQGLPPMEMNDAFQEKGMERIKASPAGYIRNVLTNPLRLFFGYPNSYYDQSLKVYYYLLINGLLYVPFLLSLVPSIYNYRHIPFSIISLMVFILIYTSALSLLSGATKQYLPILPFLVLWTGFAGSRFVRLEFRKLPKPETSAQT